MIRELLCLFGIHKYKTVTQAYTIQWSEEDPNKEDVNGEYDVDECIYCGKRRGYYETHPMIPIEK